MSAVRLNGLIAALVMLMVTACAVLPRVESPADAIAVAEGTTTALTRTVTLRLTQEAISSDQAQEYRDALARAGQFLDAATVALGAGRLPDAESYLEMAGAILDELEGRLRP